MLVTRIACPHCRKALKTTKPLAIGKRVLCKQCGTTFRVSSPDISSQTPFPARNGLLMAPAAAPSPSSTLLDDEPIATELDGGRIAKIAVVGLVLVAGFLLIGGGSLLALVYAAREEKPQATLKEKEAPRPPNRAVPEDQPISEDEPKEDPVSPPVPRLSAEEQKKVDNAVEMGLAYLKKHQTKTGSWSTAHATGMAALPALTLLECGVPADDPQVQKAAKLVRSYEPSLNKTYELSLAILFLDRLGDPADKRLIQTYALRLVAGQLADGGWTYGCPVLSGKEEKELLNILERTRPRDPLELFTGADGKVDREFVIAPKGSGSDVDGPFKGETQADPSYTAADMAKVLEKASPAMKRIPSLQPPNSASQSIRRSAGSDNSNTQFAILAVWVSGRHNVPLERTVAMIVKRFRTSQHRNGAWGYKSGNPAGNADGSPAMTAAGLLGLGVGHGMMAQNKKDPNQDGVQDPAIQNGFKALSSNIGMPLGSKRKRKNANRTEINLYFLWSVERVGVMYNLTKFLDKDWYQWGAEQLVDSQNGDGSWSSEGYPGANPILDTSLALLFLQRANLTKDLAKKLEHVIDMKNLGSR